MLHAVHSGKTQFHLRYLGHRDRTERRVPQEDEIVSIVFGGLDFMAPEEAYKFWKKLVGENQPDLMPPDQAPVQIEYEFWPHWKNNGKRLEPDLFITLKWSSESSKPATCTYLLFEFKWRSRLGDDQLHKQWKWLNEAQQERALHVFLAQETTDATFSVQKHPNDWKQGARLVPITWRNVCEIAKDFSKENSALGRWTTLVNGFLKNIGLRPFQGFDIPVKNLNLPKELPKVIFFPISPEGGANE